MRSQRSPGSASRSLGSPSRLSDHDLIALSARDPEAAQLELGVREALGIASPHSVHNAVAVGVAGLNYDIRFAPHLTDAELEREAGGPRSVRMPGLTSSTMTIVAPEKCEGLR